MLKYYCALLLLVIGFQRIEAQTDLVINTEGIPPITNYGPDDYKGFNQVWDVIQDERGLIYITTTNSINEFDGSNWKRIEKPSRSAIGRNFAINSSNRIYLGGINIIGYLTPDSVGQTQFISLLDALPPDAPMDNIEFVKYHNEKVYFSSKSGVYIYDEINTKINYFETKTKSYPNFVLNNEMHFNIAEKGIFKIENDTLTLVSDRLKNHSVSDVVVNDDQSATFISSTDGLIHFESDTTFNLDSFTDNFLKENFAYKALSLTDDYNLLCFLKAGIVITDSNWNPILQLDKDHIQDNQVHNAHLDVDGNLWLATNAGVSVIELASSLSRFTPSAGLDGKPLKIVEYLNRLYVSTTAGLYSKPWNENKDPLKKSNQYFSKVADVGIYPYDILASKIGLLVKAYETIGFVKNNTYQVLLNKTSQKSSLTFLSDSSYALTTGSNGSEIEVLGLQNEKWTHLNTIENDVIPKLVFFLMYDSKNERIWGANPSKLFSFNISSNFQEIIDYKEYTTENGLPEEERNWFQYIDDHVVFVTNQGLFEFDEKTNTFKKDAKFGSYFDDKGIQQIKNFDENNSSYWFTTNSSIRGHYSLKTNITETRMTTFSSQVESLHISDLGVLMGGNTLEFYPKKKKEKFNFEQVPLIRKVDNIKAKDSTIFWGNSTSLTIEVPYNKNALRFSYSIPYYRHPDRVQYQFKLEGFDSSWSEWSFKTQKEYTNLPAGDYFFQVKSMNAFYSESEIGGIRVKVLAPWHQTWWAFLLYFLLFLGFLKLILTLNSKRLKAENDRLESVITERTSKIIDQKNIIEKSLAERESLLKEIHHRVKNNLQIIASLLYLQSGKFEDEDFKKVLEEGQGRVRSMALIHQKLYENENLKSIPFGEYLQELVGEIRASFGMSNIQLNIEASDIHFDVDTAVPLGLIVNEMATNAFKYAFENMENGSLSIFLTEDNGTYSLKVKDDGKGIPDEIDIKKTKSLGLRLVRMLSQQLEGEFAFSNDQGTSFELKFAA